MVRVRFRVRVMVMCRLPVWLGLCGQYQGRVGLFLLGAAHVLLRGQHHSMLTRHKRTRLMSFKVCPANFISSSSALLCVLDISLISFACLDHTSVIPTKVYPC